MGSPSNFANNALCAYIYFLEMVVMMIGETLKRLRKIYGFTASELSSIINISPSYLSEIENGKKQPSLELLEKLSKLYGIKTSSLILLSEKIEDDNEKGTLFIQKMMQSLILNMSKNFEEKNEQ